MDSTERTASRFSGDIALTLTKGIVCWDVKIRFSNALATVYSFRRTSSSCLLRKRDHRSAREGKREKESEKEKRGCEGKGTEIRNNTHGHQGLAVCVAPTAHVPAFKSSRFEVFTIFRRSISTFNRTAKTIHYSTASCTREP